MRYLTVIIFIFIFLFTITFQAEARDEKATEAKVPALELFIKANSAYRNNNFQEALSLYQQVREMGFTGGDLFYNLGNCYFRLGQKGMAVLNYERARVMMPDDPDLKYNLNYVRDQLTDSIQPNKNSIRTLLFWLDSINVKEAVYTFIVINFIFWALLSIYLFKKKEITWYLLMITMLLWTVSAVSAGVKWYDFRFDERAVVISPEVNVLSGPAEGDTLLFKLHEGTVVEHERDEDGWTLIRISEDRRGWLRSNDLRLIRNNSF